MVYTQFTPLQFLGISLLIFVLLYLFTRSMGPVPRTRKRPYRPKHNGVGYGTGPSNIKEQMCGNPVHQMMQGSCKSNQCWWDDSKSSRGPNMGGQCRCPCCLNCTGAQSGNPTGTPMWCNWMCHVFPKDSPLHPDVRPNL